MTTQPQPDYTFTPTGFPPAPVIDGERWYYPQDGAVDLDTDRDITASGQTSRLLPCYRGWPIESFNSILSEEDGKVLSVIIRRVPAPAPTPAPDYPAGLPPGLVRVESGALFKGDILFAGDTGEIFESTVFCVDVIFGTVEKWREYRGPKSAVYRASAPEAKPLTTHDVCLCNDGSAAMLPDPKCKRCGGTGRAPKLPFAPEAKPPADATTPDWDFTGTSIKEDILRFKESVSKNNGLQFRHAFPESTPPAIMPPTDHSGEANGMVADHVGDANEMVFTVDEGPLCPVCGEARMKLGRIYAIWECQGPVGKGVATGCGALSQEYEGRKAALADAPRIHARAMAANGADTNRLRSIGMKLAVDGVEAITAENTRLAGERDALRSEVARLTGKLERTTDRFFAAIKIAKTKYARERKLEAEIARLKAPVDVAEFAGITQDEWIIEEFGSGSFRISTASGVMLADRPPMPDELMKESSANGRLMQAAPRLMRRVVELEARVKDLETRESKVAPLLRRYREETPLGNQPHMIAHEVDAALDEIAAAKGGSNAAGK